MGWLPGYLVSWLPGYLGPVAGHAVVTWLPGNLVFTAFPSSSFELNLRLTVNDPFWSLQVYN